jgi:hypothetical protein
LYGQLLGEVPHHRRVQEGLLLAARGIGDCTQLSQAWQQVRAYLDGETDVELHSMYERLMSERALWVLLSAADKAVTRCSMRRDLGCRMGQPGRDNL